MLAVVAVFSSCRGERTVREDVSLMEASRMELASAVEERDELLALVREISLGMEEIKRLENIMTISASRSHENKRLILKDVSSIRRVIEKRRAQLDTLEVKLRESSLYNDMLGETIDILRSQIDSQRKEVESLHSRLVEAMAEIGNLNNAVDSLCSTVSSVSEERDSAREESLRLRDELNACHYVIATKAELKKNNIIESGFLRKTRILEKEFDNTIFKAGDKRILDSIAIGSKKARILTNHPADSYVVIRRGDSCFLVIKDSRIFWSLSNYLVVQTD